MKPRCSKNLRSNGIAFSLVLLLSLIFIPFGIQAHGTKEDIVYPGSAWDRYEKPEDAGYSSLGLEKVKEYIESIKTTGLVAVVGGKILFEYGDIEQLSYIASVRKSVLAMLYGNYVADGTIKLDTTLKELGIDDHGGLLSVEQNATIDHLITARSGIYHPASNGGDSSADAPERGSQQPGEYFLYNNWDFNCAGFIFEKLTGQDIYDAIESDLARPLGMQDWDRSRQRKSGDLRRSKYPAYHQWYSTRDMARLGYLMLRRGEWKGKQIIPRDWAQKIVTVVTPLEKMNPTPLRRGRLAYGYMWWLWSGPKATGPYAGAYSARGAYGQYITVLPVLDMVIAHKTAVPPNRSVNMIEYAGIMERLIKARIN